MSSPAIEQVAKEAFGVDQLGQAQREAIESVLSGRDTLVVMPAGAPRTAIHQISSHMCNGPCVLVCPADPPEAAAEAVVLDPEDLAADAVLAQAREAGPRLIVIDDAQCVAESAEEFLPDCLRLGPFIAEMGHPTVLALTASGSLRVHEEIAERLHLHDPVVVTAA